jgi:nucleotide-binding universal stress UspA family protein
VAFPAKLRKFVNAPVANWRALLEGRRKKCTPFRKSCGARFYSRTQTSRMKTVAQRIQTADTIELVPQILRLKKILVPTDFSETSKKALQYALRFAEQFGCEIALLYVVEPATPIVEAPLPVEVLTGEDEFSMAENDLARLAAESHTNDAHSVSSFVRVGHAPNEITKTANDLDVDLIIIATHGYTSWRHFCIGSTAERVVRTAPCPVLVVREKEHEFV